MQGSYLGTTDDTSTCRACSGTGSIITSEGRAADCATCTTRRETEHVRVVFPVVVDMHRADTSGWVVDLIDPDFDVSDCVLVARVEGFGFIGTWHEPTTAADDAVVDDAVDIVRRLLDRGQR